MKRIRRVLTSLLTAVLLMICTGFAALAENVMTLPTSLKVIEEEAFYGDRSIDRVIVPEGTTGIRSKAFARSSLKVIELPVSLTDIADDAFDGCQGVEVQAEKGSAAYYWAVQHGYVADLDVSAVMTVLGISGKLKTEANGYYITFESTSITRTKYYALVQYLLDRGYTQTVTDYDYHEWTDTISEYSVFSSSEAEIKVNFYEILPKLTFYCSFHRHYSYQENIYQPTDLRIETMAGEFGCSGGVSGWTTGEIGGSFTMSASDMDFLEQARAYLKQYRITLTKALNEDIYFYETEQMNFSMERTGSTWYIRLRAGHATPVPRQIGFDVRAVMESFGINGTKTVEADGYYVKFEGTTITRQGYYGLVQYLLDRGYTQTVTDYDYHEGTDTISEYSVFSSSEAEIKVNFYEILPKLTFYCSFHRHYSYPENIYQPTDLRAEEMAWALGFRGKIYEMNSGRGRTFTADSSDCDFLDEARAYLKQYSITLSQETDQEKYFYENDRMSLSITKSGGWKVQLEGDFYVPGTPDPTPSTDPSSGSSRCPRCLGSGRQDCSSCSMGNCGSCGGSGGSYRYYSGGNTVWENCISCHGSGDCSHCHGSGEVTCSLCSGSGTIH